MPPSSFTPTISIEIEFADCGVVGAIITYVPTDDPSETLRSGVKVPEGKNPPVDVVMPILLRKLARDIERVRDGDRP